MKSLHELKPPAGVEGILDFGQDVPLMYSPEEQRTLSITSAGRRLGQAIVTCERIKPPKSPPRDAGAEASIEKRLSLYKDCLARAVCEQRWKLYSQCWSTTVGSMRADRLQSLGRERGLKSICQMQRRSLERCIGHTISAAVRDSDSRSNRVFS